MKNPTKQPNIALISTPALELDRFVKHMESLSSSLVPVLKSILRELKKKQSRLKKVLRIKGKLKKRKGKKSYVISGKDIAFVERIRQEFDKTRLSFEAIPIIFFVSLVNRFEAFTSDLIRVLISLRPEILTGSQQQFSLEQLLDMRTIEDAREHLYETHIDSKLRDGYYELFQWLKTVSGVNVKNELKSWSAFVEIIQRRHVFVHHDGRISNEYLRKCKKSGVQDIDKLRKGDRLKVSPEYFREAYRCLFEVAVKLTHSLWRSLRHDQITASDSDLVKLTYKLLGNGHYHLACRLLDYACLQLTEYSSDEYKRVFIINRAQAYKWRNNEKECQAILDGIDWSACNERYKFAVAVLRNDYSQAVNLMHMAAKTNRIHEREYIEWPLLRKFRQKAVFLKAYKEIYGHQFSKEEISK